MKFNMFIYRLKKIACLLLITVSFFNTVKAEERAIASKSDRCEFKIAVCDWMILKRQKIGAFELVRELNGDGVEMDMGALGKRDSFDNKLRQPEFQKLFRDKTLEYELEVPSIAMSGFYAQSFVERKDYRRLVEDCIKTMQVMGAKVAFLPLGVQCDLNVKPEIRPELIKRLKEVGEMALKTGVVIGIETALDAKGEVSLLKEINSKGIKIYYNFQNPLVAGRDLYKELRILGKDRICQIHCTDTDEVNLPDNKRLDMNKVKNVLVKMGWCGWLVVERSRDKSDVHNVKKNYGTNIEYLKSVFD
ncbi:MAG: sugar phosphate isomerase/epimerase family protein [Paludibacter sp.]